MRKLNQNMHRVYKQYLDQKATKSDSELVVSSVDQNQNPKVIYEEKDTDLQIKLDYNGIQVMRRVNVTTTNRVVYHLAQQYLREVFALRVTNLSDLLLLHRHYEIPIDGNVGDIPILDGDEIMVMFRRWGNSERTQRQPDLRFDDEESDEDSSKSEGDEDDYWTECWPSQTGMRKGNPKRDFHKDGTRRNNKRIWMKLPLSEIMLITTEKSVMTLIMPGLQANRGPMAEHLLLGETLTVTPGESIMN